MRLFILLNLLAITAYPSEPQVLQSGNNNVNNICQPKIVVQACKKSCVKPKVIVKYKTIYKTKVVKSKPIIKYKTRVKKYFRTVHIEPKKNRIRFLGGAGPTGVSAQKRGNRAYIQEKRGVVIGLGYDRLMNNKISLGGQILSNETYMLGVGVDF